MGCGCGKAGKKIPVTVEPHKSPELIAELEGRGVPVHRTEGDEGFGEGEDK